MENASIYIGAGPYISAALSGKFEPQTIDGNIIQDDPNKLDLSFDAKFGNDPYSNFKRLDYGANAIAGLRLNNGLLFNNGYDMGFANVQSDHYFYSSTKNRSIHFGLGYQF